MRAVGSAILMFCVVAVLLVYPVGARGAVLTADTLWKGEVTLAEDILVPAGVTLTIAPGTVVRVGSAESSRTDPEYLSPLVELTVRGTLRVEGEGQAPVRFLPEVAKKEGGWAGIIVDGGTALLAHCRIEGAETGLHLIDGTLDLSSSLLTGNRYGLVVQGKGAALRGAGNSVTGNDYGIVNLARAQVAASLAVSSGNRKKNLLDLSLREYLLPPERVTAAAGAVGRHYADEVLNGETVWQGRVEVDGIVRVPEGARLVILPGTVVEFGWKDTNGDGIGETGLLVQGVIIAKGSAASPIVFRSAGGGRRGAWDAINIMNSAGVWNLVEHCRIEDAYRGLHFHFSRVAVTNSLFRNSWRAIQFQESTVLARGNRFFGNRSAVQGRDSEVDFADNTVAANFQGISFLRSRLTARGNRIFANGRDGVRIREGSTIFEENAVDGNRYGILVMDAFYGTFARNAVTNNAETGFSLKNTDNMDVSANFVAGNGTNGLSLQDSRGRVSGNVFSANGERGVGIQSFSGVLTENGFSANGLYAVGLDGGADVAAPRNWWGRGDPGRVIYDRKNDTTLGTVSHPEPASRPFPFTWPTATIAASLTWRDDIVVKGTVTVPPGVTLTVAPHTRVLFAGGAGLAVKGRIIAKGEGDGRIVFSAADRKEPSAWDEIMLEHADGSTFGHCIIEYATWGLHSHFTRLAVSDSIIRKNYGGIRFHSGPLEVTRTVVTKNTIGIRSFGGNGIVRQSAITGNETGVFVREKGGGLTLTGNNIFANRGYNIRFGDFNTEDMAAPDNWWGEGDPYATIFDARQEPGIGTARIEPFRQAPLKLALPADDERQTGGER